MSEMRITLRDQFKKETGKDCKLDLVDYTDWLELRFTCDPKEQAVNQMEKSLRQAADALDLARFHVKRVFNEESSTEPIKITDRTKKSWKKNTTNT